MQLPAYSRPVSELVGERYSCRVFASPDDRTFVAIDALISFAKALSPGPRGGSPRFELFAARPEDPNALRGLGTYGFIKDPSAFLAAVLPLGVDIVDLGWATELAVLKATELGLGSCWIGGTFRRGRFAKAAKVGRGERLAIVVALGKPTPDAREGALRRRIAGGSRKSWAETFYSGGFERPIVSAEDLERLGIDPKWSRALEALRLSPSASNKQPWALVRGESAWQLYLRRTPRYMPPWAKLIGLADMQMNDMGIAMAHFALAAHELGIGGAWEPAPVEPPGETRRKADREAHATADAIQVAVFAEKP